jgi:2-isopropylmalate synthase
MYGEESQLVGWRVTRCSIGAAVSFARLSNGPIDAAVNAFGLPIRVDSYEERSIDSGADARAVAFIEATAEGVMGSKFGVGIDRSIVVASLRALISAANRLGLADRWQQRGDRRAA